MIDLDGIQVSAEDATYTEQIVTCGMSCGKYNTLSLAKRCIDEGIPGDFVECGVNAGGHPAIMAYVSKKYDAGRRKVHLFDSFEGLPMAGPDDSDLDKTQYGYNEDRINIKAAKKLIAERWQVDNNLKAWGADPALLVFHTGWFQNVLPIDGPLMGAIALLRIDVDLYDSTTPVYEYLYDHVPSGGYIISDDWGEQDYPIPPRTATLKWLEKRGIPVPPVKRLVETPGTVWWRKP